MRFQSHTLNLRNRQIAPAMRSHDLPPHQLSERTKAKGSRRMLVIIEDIHNQQLSFRPTVLVCVWRTPRNSCTPQPRAGLLCHARYKHSPPRVTRNCLSAGRYETLFFSSPPDLQTTVIASCSAQTSLRPLARYIFHVSELFHNPNSDFSGVQRDAYCELRSSSYGNAVRSYSP